MAERPFCNSKNLTREIRYLASRVALVELADHVCYTHKVKKACKSLFRERKAIDKMANKLQRELKNCLGK